MTRDAGCPEESGAQAFVRILIEHGVEYVFCFPGGLIEPTHQELRRHFGAHAVLARSDAAAVRMADGYARARGVLGVAIVTGGPGVAEAFAASAAAKLDGVPLLIVSGDVATPKFGRDVVQESYGLGIPMTRALEAATKDSTRAIARSQLEHCLYGAIRMALVLPAGPVHVALPRDIQAASSAQRAPRSALIQSRVFDPLEAGEVADRLSAAQRPLLVLGASARAHAAWSALGALASRCQAAVIETPRGKGSFDARSPLALGVLGFGGHASAEAAFREADQVVAFGELNDLATDNFSLQPRGHLVQVDLQPGLLGTGLPVQLACVADVAAFATEVTRRLREPSSSMAARRDWIARVRAEHAQVRPCYREGGDRVPLLTSHALLELRRLTDVETQFFCCVGTCMPFALHLLELTKPRRFSLPLGLGPIGWALPAGIGAALAQPNLPCVVLVGDVSLDSAAAELGTLAVLGLNLLVFALQNSGHAFVGNASRREFLEGCHDEAYATPVPLVELARARGLRAVRATTIEQIRTATAEWRAQPGPMLIEAVVQRDEFPPIEGRLRGLVEPELEPRG